MAGVDTSIYNNVWKPDPMQGISLQEKLLGIKNAQIQNQLLYQQQQSDQLDLSGKQALNNALMHHTNEDGTVDMAGVQRDLGNSGATNTLDVIGKGNALNAPTKGGIDAQGRPLFQGAQAVSAGFNPHPSAPAIAPQPAIPQDQLDAHHEQLDYMRQNFDDLAKLPDSELSLRKLYQTGADLGAKYAESGGKLGVPYSEVASEMSGPDFPKAGPNGESPPPQAIRQFLQNHSQRLAKAQTLLAHGAGVHSSQIQPAATGAMPQQDQHQAMTTLYPESKPATEAPAKVMSLPVGFEHAQAPAQEHLTQVRTARDSAGQTDAVLSQIENLSKSGAPTGSKIGQMYSALAKSFPGLVPQGVTDQAAQLDEIKKYMEQTALAGGIPASDARLAAVQGSNPNSEQLPQAIQALVPFLKATNEGARARANYYDKVAGDGLDYNAINKARETWSNNYDPRGVLITEMPHADAVTYLKSLPKEARDKVVKSAKFVKPYVGNAQQ